MIRRSGWRALGAVCALGLFTIAGIAAQKYRAEQQLFFPVRRSVALPASGSGLTGASDVEFIGNGNRLRGWYVPTKNHALVILCHGAGANRAQLSAEAGALVAANFGVLLFDWPGHGESEGAIHWNEGERASLRAAVSWALARPGLDPLRLGAYGFSMGGYTLSQVAAEDIRLHAVALAGTPADQRQQVHFQHQKLGPLAEWPALYALRQGGMEIELRRPIDEVRRIGPRPLLSIGGSDDHLVSPTMASDLANAAGQSAALYIVEGAPHGNYVSIAGNVYLERVVSFFRLALLSGAS